MFPHVSDIPTDYVIRLEPRPADQQRDLTRQAFLRAFAAWLKTHPTPQEIEAELYGTASAMRQMTGLLR